VLIRAALALLFAAAAPAATWRAPANPAVSISAAGHVVSTVAGAYDLLSDAELPASPGDVFELRVRIKVDLHTIALPDLACYDAQGRLLDARSPLESANRTSTTAWQEFRRIFPVQPGTARVRARLRASGRGAFDVEGLEFRPARVDPYQTGALISQIHPRLRRGLVLEAELAIVNRDHVSADDRDGDGKWARIRVDLDSLSKLESAGVDWRTKFEYKPNEIYWSDGAVLKSDSVRQDRAPDPARALHFRARVHDGRYRAILNDPGRAIAVSLDGRVWQRFEGGEEVDLGTVVGRGGALDLWIDAPYRDPVSAGPVYFDYVRLLPRDDAARNRAFVAAARRKRSAAPGESAGERRVPITVSAPLYAAGAGWPVRCGLPIPPGELADASHAAVLDASGRAIPSQNRALAEWPDGGVKWLSLDFRHDFSTASTARYTVAYGGKARARAASGGVVLRETAAGVEVDTGAIRFLVPKATFGLVENVRAADGRVLQRGAVRSEIEEVSGQRWPIPDARVAIEQRGPLHAVVAAEARGFRARIHAYAGSALVGVDYFLANMDDRPAVQVRSIALVAPATGSASGAEVLATEARAAERAKARGWGSNGALAVGVEDFAQQYPKALRWSPAGVEIALWAREGGVYDWIQGVGKTHRIALHYGAPQTDAALLAHGPVLALADPEWYARSGAFGPIDLAAHSPLPEVEKTLARHMAERVVGEVGFGFENYGDHSSSGYVKGSYLWDNNEYDVPAAAIIHFVRTGDVGALRVGLAGAQHYVDVDRIHYSRVHPDHVGAAHTHSHGDVGHHTADAPNMHHAGYVQGLIWATYFTGDPYGLDGARSIADWALRNLKPEANVGQMERALGHPLNTLNDVYEATWDERYLAGAARLVEWATRWEHPVHSGLLAPITEQPAYYSGSTFNSGLTYSALLKFNSWARLPEVDAMLERIARWTLTEMWRPPAGVMSKGGSPRRKADPDNIASHLRLMRDVYRRTRDPLFLAVPWEALVAGFGTADAQMGTRSTGLVFNYAPWYLAMLGELGDPRPGKLEVRPVEKSLAVEPGGAVQACFDVKNAEAATAEDLRIGFQTRLDFTASPPPAAPARLEPGESARLCYDTRAPEAINLTSEWNRTAYAQWTATYRAGGRPRFAHAFARIDLRQPR
jgi:hypothetical protein